MPTALYVAGGRAKTEFCVVDLDPAGVQLIPLARASALRDHCQSGRPLWLRITGLEQPHAIREALTILGVPDLFHPLLLDVPQATRVDSFGDVITVVMHRLRLSRDPAVLVSDQVGMVLLPHVLISVEESPSEQPFAPLIQWLQTKAPPPGAEDLDDLLHFMVDSLLDPLLPMLEQMANRLDDLEEAALRDPSPKLLNRAFQLRSNLREIRRQLWPLRNQLMVFLRQNQPIMGPEGLKGFKDMIQTVAHLFDTCEMLRHQCDSVTEAHVASTGNRMNQIMKTLTIVSTIFAPLTFLAGIYGMNFEFMPELKWSYGYPACLAVMALIATVQATWLWRRGWFVDWTGTRPRR